MFSPIEELLQELRQGRMIIITDDAGRENEGDLIAASGALISEYPPGTAAEAWHFPVRNRIISGLSLALA